MHIDQNGELQRATVNVLEALPLERMVLVRRSPEDEPLAIQQGRSIETIDMPEKDDDVGFAWVDFHVGARATLS